MAENKHLGKNNEEFILSLHWNLKKKQKKGFPKNSVFHKHHIELKHAGGDPNGPLVYCTARDHARAHYIRYLVYNEKYDLCAYYRLE